MLDEDTCAFSQSNEKVAFSSVCCQISDHISKNMSNDISVPICFVFLLHLANEKVRFCLSHSLVVVIAIVVKHIALVFSVLGFTLFL